MDCDLVDVDAVDAVDENGDCVDAQLLIVLIGSFFSFFGDE